MHFVSWCFQWFVLGLSLFSISILICGFVMQNMCLMKCFYELSMSCEVINKGIYIVLVNLASNKPSWQTEFGLVNAQRHDHATEIWWVFWYRWRELACCPLGHSEKLVLAPPLRWVVQWERSFSYDLIEVNKFEFLRAWSLFSGYPLTNAARTPKELGLSYC